VQEQALAGGVGRLALQRPQRDRLNRYSAAVLRDAGWSERVARIERLQPRAIQRPVKDKRFATALELLQALPGREPNWRLPAMRVSVIFVARQSAIWQQGNSKEAPSVIAPSIWMSPPTAPEPVDTRRRIVQWMSRVRDMLAESLEISTKTVTAAEKKRLKEMFEKGLGVSRRKPAPRKAAKQAVAKSRRFLASGRSNSRSGSEFL